MAWNVPGPKVDALQDGVKDHGEAGGGAPDHEPPGVATVQRAGGSIIVLSFSVGTSADGASSSNIKRLTFDDAANTTGGGGGDEHGKHVLRRGGVGFGLGLPLPPVETEGQQRKPVVREP
ncbi:hypothetical protein GCG54_00000101 [Colletotrichum gloeosporioides]|uniref:Uncharacterized protein n=1 Tax=Colletotrichum gloeosporioides TaxID=474922 RepID=A0A8H4FLQ4_COLGL|nr:uncharacterized protein GCG54_00000101 [Colletotrichum gloeosporioides]KAF3806735.1 hypothetical protein GCG54_00000101 [Colletotrichum gloeosporioides]